MVYLYQSVPVCCPYRVKLLCYLLFFSDFLKFVISFLLFTLVRSLNVILKLIDDNVGNRELTLERCCKKIILHLSSKVSLNVFEDVIWTFRSCFVLLHEWSTSSNRKWDNTFKQILNLNDYFFTHAEERFLEESLVTKDRILAGKLVMSSKILEKLTNPNDAVLCCLQILQELHDHPDIQELFRPMIEPVSLSSIKKKSLTADAASVKNMNKILFEFARTFIKPPSTVQDWPATIKLDGKFFNPLEKESQNIGRTNLDSGDFDDDSNGDFELKETTTDVTEQSVLIFEITGNRYILSCVVNTCYFFSVRLETPSILIHEFNNFPRLMLPYLSNCM